MILSSSRPGYVFLLTILVIGAVASATASSLMLLGWAAEQNGLLVQESIQAFEYAHTCAERALRELRRDLNYSGDKTFVFDRGTCDIERIGGSGNEKRMVCVSGSSGDSTRRMELSIDRLYPAVIMRSWNEVASFSLCP